MTGQTTTSALRGVAGIAEDLGSATDPIATLRLLKELHDWLTAAQTTAVGQAMVAGHTHSDIGEALGVSQQAISKRYGCGKQEEKDIPEEKPKAAPIPKALMHFTPDGNYVGYSLSVAVDGMDDIPRPPRQRASRQPAPDAAHEKSWASDADVGDG